MEGRREGRRHERTIRHSADLSDNETPSIDRIANEGIQFLHYYGEQSCTAGRAAFRTGPQDPFERADVTPNTYWDRNLNHLGQVYCAA